MDGNCLAIQRPGDSRNSAEHDQRLNRQGKAPNKFAQQIQLNQSKGLSENEQKLLHQSEA